ncbi:hypothetical protein MP228_012544 [Amoeboaphelidium protococcarum]|nr:hypothetical protein MP228_012544 [Amoeboaphelidium protococcarum]
MFSFASVKANFNQQLINRFNNGNHGPYNVQIQGEVFHLISNIGVTNNYADIYLLDPQQQVNRRQQYNYGLPELHLRSIQDFIIQHNPLARLYQQQGLQRQLHQEQQFQIRLRENGNIITPADEVALLIENDEAPRDVVLKPHYVINRQQPFEIISQYNAMYDPLAYTIMFPTGFPGYTLDLRAGGKNVTVMQYYSYQLMMRPTTKDYFRFNKLLQIYSLDQYYKMTCNRLRYLEVNNEDIMPYRNEDSPEIMLPSTFVGSPRYMRQKYLDAMSLVRKYNKPDYFITMTCNPNWPEIKDNLLPSQTAADRPDIVDRVFAMKIEALMKMLKEKKILGKLWAQTLSIEFQKRGLPHMHMLVWVDKTDKPRNSADIERVINAQVPSEEFPNLRAKVLMHMIHSQCIDNPNAQCIINGECQRNFPKDFSASTVVNDDGYPEYKRTNQHPLNQYVVPYNAYLLQKFDCHINVEYCASIKAVKYLFKYVFKGRDHAEAEIFRENEILKYINSKYVSVQEGLWRLFGFAITKQYPAVIKLDLHLPGTIEESSLLSWFKYNREHTPNDPCRSLSYISFISQYTYNESNKQWTKRINSSRTLARMPFIQVTAGELYYLRLLLHSVEGATSYEDLKTIDGVQHQSFKDAAYALGLLADQNEQFLCLAEAVQECMPIQLRKLYCHMLAGTSFINYFDAWETFADQLCQDYIYKAQSNPLINPMQEGLHDIKDLLEADNKPIKNFPLLDLLLDDQYCRADNQQTAATSIQTNQDTIDIQIASLAPTQRMAFDQVIRSIREPEYGSKCFLISGLAGYGKTYLYELISNQVTALGQSGINLATTGIASLNLPNAATVHSFFGLDLELHEQSICKQSAKNKEKMLKSSYILIDEATALSKHALDAIDRHMRSLATSRNGLMKDRPFGGTINANEVVYESYDTVTGCNDLEISAEQLRNFDFNGLPLAALKLKASAIQNYRSLMATGKMIQFSFQGLLQLPPNLKKLNFKDISFQ